MWHSYTRYTEYRNQKDHLNKHATTSEPFFDPKKVVSIQVPVQLGEQKVDLDYGATGILKKACEDGMEL